MRLANIFPSSVVRNFVCFIELIQATLFYFKFKRDENNTQSFINESLQKKLRVNALQHSVTQLKSERVVSLAFIEYIGDFIRTLFFTLAN